MAPLIPEVKGSNSPRQIVVELLPVIPGKAFIVKVVTVVFTQLVAAVPVIVYVWVDEEVEETVIAVTLEPVETAKSVAGDQV